MTEVEALAKKAAEAIARRQQGSNNDRSWAKGLAQEITDFND